MNVERVNVGVIVTDRKGKFAEDLQRKDFRIADDGVEQPITDFASVEEPGQVLLLVEAGPAVYLLQDAHLFVADALLNGLAAGDRVSVARYIEAPLSLLDFNTDKRFAQAALDQIQFNLGYGQLNLSASLNVVLDWLARVPGKKTIVLLSTGVDTSDQSAMQSLLARLEVGEVRMLCIAMSGPLRSGKDSSKHANQHTDQAFDTADAWLTALADATGGRAYFPQNAQAFQETYRQVAQLVRHEYSLAFAPAKADGAIHAIEVRVVSAKDKAQKYRVDHRKAYVAPNPPE